MPAEFGEQRHRKRMDERRSPLQLLAQPPPTAVLRGNFLISPRDAQSPAPPPQPPDPDGPAPPPVHTCRHSAQAPPPAPSVRALVLSARAPPPHTCRHSA